MTYATISPQMMNPRDIAGNAEEVVKADPFLRSILHVAGTLRSQEGTAHVEVI